jgi:hypothetical protein
MSILFFIKAFTYIVYAYLIVFFLAAIILRIAKSDRAANICYYALITVALFGVIYSVYYFYLFHSVRSYSSQTVHATLIDRYPVIPTVYAAKVKYTTSDNREIETTSFDFIPTSHLSRYRSGQYLLEGAYYSIGSKIPMVYNTQNPNYIVRANKNRNGSVFILFLASILPLLRGVITKLKPELLT